MRLEDLCESVAVHGVAVHGGGHTTDGVPSANAIASITPSVTVQPPTPSDARSQFRGSHALIDQPGPRVRPLDLYIVGKFWRRRTRWLQ